MESKPSDLALESKPSDLEIFNFKANGLIIPSPKV
jgi:hypothetical protein